MLGRCSNPHPIATWTPIQAYRDSHSLHSFKGNKGGRVFGRGWGSLCNYVSKRNFLERFGAVVGILGLSLDASLCDVLENKEEIAVFRNDGAHNAGIASIYNALCTKR